MKITQDMDRPAKADIQKKGKNFQFSNSEYREMRRAEAFFRSKRRGRFGRSNLQELLESDPEIQ